MKVRCKANNSNALPEDFLSPKTAIARDIDYAVTEGVVYVVYALCVQDGLVSYYVCDSPHITFPSAVPCPLFEIVDGRVSRYWEFSYRAECSEWDPKRVYYHQLFAFPEWTRNDLFFERLLDDHPEGVAVFAKYRRLMQEEFGIDDVGPPRV